MIGYFVLDLLAALLNVFALNVQCSRICILEFLPLVMIRVIIDIVCLCEYMTAYFIWFNFSRYSMMVRISVLTDNRCQYILYRKLYIYY
ncbi:hypothetical protein V1478_013610 [Vespula squamosa]|uniref:Secreted peptide n=1 Tax=Vespula squamosa TaxID=30214 RepID=A0ABD2A5M2_VESSQ